MGLEKMIRWIFRLYNKTKKTGKENLAKEEEELLFRLIRNNIDDWEKTFRAKIKSEKNYDEIIQLLNSWCLKRRFRILYFLYENKDILLKLKDKVDIHKIILSLINNVKKEKIWWMRKWIILTLNIYWEKLGEKIPEVKKIYSNERNELVKIELIKLMGRIGGNETEEFFQEIKKEKSIEITKNLAVVLPNLKLIGLEDIILVLTENNKYNQIIRYGIYFAEKLNFNSDILNDLPKHLENKNKKLIVRVMLAWILANIVYKSGKMNNSMESILKLLDEVEEDKRNRNEKIWLALALIRIDRDNERGKKIWKAMKEDFRGIRVEHRLEYEEIMKDGPYISQKEKIMITDIQTILKLPKEKAYFDMKGEQKFIEPRNKAELIKDIITLTNSAHQNDNRAYLIIGIVERNHKILSVKNVENYKEIDKAIGDLINHYINKKPTTEFFETKIYDLYKWKCEGLISEEIPFTEEQTKETNTDKIVIIQFQREKCQVYEVAKEFKPHIIGQSWIRIGENTKNLTQDDREILMKK